MSEYMNAIPFLSKLLPYSLAKSNPKWIKHRCRENKPILLYATFVLSRESKQFVLNMPFCILVTFLWTRFSMKKPWFTTSCSALLTSTF